jgi:hypothetical protein
MSGRTRCSTAAILRACALPSSSRATRPPASSSNNEVLYVATRSVPVGVDAMASCSLV